MIDFYGENPMDEGKMRKIFFEIHEGLPREGPGSFESTQKAYSMLSNLPADPKILDIGCGPGMQTLDLSRLTNGSIISIDNHPTFLEVLRKKVVQNGLSDRIFVQEGDMFNLHFEEKSFDVIWAEGSIYIIGFERGLREWKPLLKFGGYLAVTEVSWLKPDAPAEIKKFWEENYPAMHDIDSNLKILQGAGYHPVGHFTIPESSWWDDYYNPIEKKLVTLCEKYKNDDQALQILKIEQQEIDYFREYAEFYGYVFYIAQVH